MDVQGKTVIITGASSGIGLATAQLLAQKGAKVVLAARSADRLAEIMHQLLQDGYEAIAVPTDVRHKGEVEKLVHTATNHFAHPDILINNAGRSLISPVADIDESDFHEIIRLNLMGCLFAMQAVIPAMREHGGGIIVNVSSRLSKMALPSLAAYAATKAALDKLSDTARTELAPDNIRVISIFPRRTDTEFGKNAMGSHEAKQAMARAREAAMANVAAGTSANAPVNPGSIVDSAEFVAERILLAIENEVTDQQME